MKWLSFRFGIFFWKILLPSFSRSNYLCWLKINNRPNFCWLNTRIFSICWKGSGKNWKYMMEQESKGPLKLNGSMITDKNNYYKNDNVIKEKWAKKHWCMFSLQLEKYQKNYSKTKKNSSKIFWKCIKWWDSVDKSGKFETVKGLSISLWIHLSWKRQN